MEEGREKCDTKRGMREGPSRGGTEGGEIMLGVGKRQSKIRVKRDTEGASAS